MFCLSEEDVLTIFINHYPGQVDFSMRCGLKKEDNPPIYQILARGLPFTDFILEQATPEQLLKILKLILDAKFPENHVIKVRAKIGSFDSQLQSLPLNDLLFWLRKFVDY